MAKIIDYFSISENKFLNLLSVGLKNPHLINHQSLKNFYEFHQEEKNKKPDIYFICLIKNSDEDLDEHFYFEFFIDSENVNIDIEDLEDLIKETLIKNKKFKNISIQKYLHGYISEQTPYELQIMFFDFILRNITTKSEIKH